jgi:hypothetical protein
VSAALSPDLAVAYVRELSADVRAVVVLAADGELLAGPPALAAPARELLAAAGDRMDVACRTADGVVMAARTPAHAIVVAAGPHSLVGPTALDARTAVEALAGGPAPDAAAGRGAPDAGVTQALRTAAEAVISATQRAI